MKPTYPVTRAKCSEDPSSVPNPTLYPVSFRSREPPLVIFFLASPPQLLLLFFPLPPPHFPTYTILHNVFRYQGFHFGTDRPSVFRLLCGWIRRQAGWLPLLLRG